MSDVNLYWHNLINSNPLIFVRQYKAKIIEIIISRGLNMALVRVTKWPPLKRKLGSEHYIFCFRMTFET